MARPRGEQHHRLGPAVLRRRPPDGLRPVLLVPRCPARYPYVATDGVDARVVDTMDLAAVLDACAPSTARCAGVTSSSEYFIAIASGDGPRPGLPHPDPAAIRACRDKHAQRETLAAPGLPVPAFAAATSPAEAVAAADEIGPAGGGQAGRAPGSVAIRRCATSTRSGPPRAPCCGTTRPTSALPPQSFVMVEQYLSGAEFSVETLDARVVGITAKHLGPEPYFVEIGHDFPAPAARRRRAPRRRRRPGRAACARARLGPGPRRAALHGPAGARIVEVNPRLAGGMIPRMVEQATGIDMVGTPSRGPPGRPRHRADPAPVGVDPLPGRVARWRASRRPSPASRGPASCTSCRGGGDPSGRDGCRGDGTRSPIAWLCDCGRALGGSARPPPLSSDSALDAQTCTRRTSRRRSRHT